MDDETRRVRICHQLNRWLIDRSITSYVRSLVKKQSKKENLLRLRKVGKSRVTAWSVTTTYQHSYKLYTCSSHSVMIKDSIVLPLSIESGLKTEVVSVCLVLCPFSCWSCLTARTRGRGTSWRPSCIGFMESSWGCGPSSGSRSTTFSCGEWNVQTAANVTGKHVWCCITVMLGVFLFLYFQVSSFIVTCTPITVKQSLFLVLLYLTR